jgi:hypothetical protein
MLWNLIHSKTHAWTGDPWHPDPDMVKVFKKYTSTYSKDLYRGTKSSDDIERLLEGYSIGFSSFSEHESIAKKFGKVITIKGPSQGFCYWDWIVNECEWLKENYEDEYDQIDGDFMISEAKKEAEWIMPHDMKLEVIDAKKLIFKQKNS